MQITCWSQAGTPTWYMITFQIYCILQIFDVLIRHHSCHPSHFNGLDHTFSRRSQALTSGVEHPRAWLLSKSVIGQSVPGITDLVYLGWTSKLDIQLGKQSLVVLTA